MRGLLLDNYDSFTYNLAQYLQELGVDLTVARNDDLTATQIMTAKYDFHVISPGPSDPDHAGVSLDLVMACVQHHRPLLGVCLGHQALGQALGGRVIQAPHPVHGKRSAIVHQNCGVFAGLPSPFWATRYHSLVVERSSLPIDLEVTATVDDLIMGMRHRHLPIEGVQFHPESVFTEHGLAILQNFMNTIR